MEYVLGIKINRVKQLDKLGVDQKRLSRYAVGSYLEQILSHGFFHADPIYSSALCAMQQNTTCYFIKNFMRLDPLYLEGKAPTCNILKQQYAFNIFSHNAPVLEDGYNQEEIKMVKETRKSLLLLRRKWSYG